MNLSCECAVAWRINAQRGEDGPALQWEGMSEQGEFPLRRGWSSWKGMLPAGVFVFQLLFVTLSALFRNRRLLEGRKEEERQAKTKRRERQTSNRGRGAASTDETRPEFALLFSYHRWNRKPSLRSSVEAPRTYTHRQGYYGSIMI